MKYMLLVDDVWFGSFETFDGAYRALAEQEERFAAMGAGERLSYELRRETHDFNLGAAGVPPVPTVPPTHPDLRT